MNDEPKFHSDGGPGSILWVMGGWAFFVCVAVAYFILKYCGVL